MPSRLRVLAASLTLAAVPSPTFAQSTTPPLAVGGYVQPQWEHLDDGGEGRDRALFRRIVVGLEIGLDERWSGEIQVDLAPATEGNRLLLRDGYLRYAAPRLAVAVGNQKMPFSRSVLTSSSRRSLIERPVTGERAYGAPGRAIGVRADGRIARARVLWSAVAASALHAPDAAEIRIDGLPAAGADWNEGVLTGARAEWHPRGEVALSQGAFDVTRPLVTVAGGFYRWLNDGDRNLHTTGGVSHSSLALDLRQATGLELSAALRLPRVAVDLELQRITSRALDRAFTGGLYVHGRARLIKASVEAGVMLLAARLEAVGAVDALDIEHAAARAVRPAAGLVWYLRRHRLKLSLMHRATVNAGGISGARVHTSLLQAHLGF